MIETERLLLRVPREEDLDGWAALMGDEESARFIGGVMPRSTAWRGMAAMTGSWSLRGYGMFSVIEKASNRWIGRVGPWCPEGWPGTEVGWALGRWAWGNGYAFEAASASIDWAFAALGWSEVIHIIAPENARSRQLASRLGADLIGPTRIPPPHDTIEVDLWRQTRERWAGRSG